jgi:hypothetical protein
MGQEDATFNSGISHPVLKCSPSIFDSLAFLAQLLWVCILKDFTPRPSKRK